MCFFLHILVRRGLLVFLVFLALWWPRNICKLLLELLLVVALHAYILVSLELRFCLG